MIELKVGDIVECLPGFDKSEGSGGQGYKPGRVMVITEIASYGTNDALVWERDIQNIGIDGYHYLQCGVYVRAVKKLNPINPIKRLKKHNMI